jgi:hypothetical protein
MIVLQIEHKVPNYQGWKKAFDSDPINRKKSGVRRHRIFRPADDPDYVVVQLEFETLEEAEKALSALRNLWTRVEGKIMVDPQTRMFNIAEAIEY